VHQFYCLQRRRIIILLIDDLETADVNIIGSSHFLDLILVTDKNRLCNITLFSCRYRFQYGTVLCNRNRHLLDTALGYLR
jgi:hypothetical protein